MNVPLTNLEQLCDAVTMDKSLRLQQFAEPMSSRLNVVLKARAGPNHITKMYLIKCSVSVSMDTTKTAEWVV